MKVKRPVPNTIKYRDNRYNWVNNYAYKSDADKRIKSLERQGAKAIVVSIIGTGITKYAVYVRHDLGGILAK